MKLFHHAPASAVQARDRRDARQHEDDAAQWRDYYTWLRSQQTLLDGRIADAQPTFERTTDAQAVRAAQAAIDRIPVDNRALFAAILAEERQAAQLRLEAAAPQRGALSHADPDVVEQQALTTLLAQAAGEVATPETPVGYGWFPRGVPGDVRWYALDVADLLAVPTAAAYQLGDTGTDVRRRLLMVGAATIGLVIFLLVWFGLRPTRPQPAVATVPLVADGAVPNATPVAMELAPITAVIVRQGEQETRVALSATIADGWPAPTTEKLGYWHQGRFAPSALCLDGALLHDLSGLTLLGGGGWPDRIYRISEQATGADLVVEACHGATRRYGALEQLAVPAVATLGTPTALPGQDATLTVESIVLVGPGDDPTLPLGQARVVVAVRGPAGLDWPAYTPTLITPDGQRALPAETMGMDAGVALRYLIALPTRALPIAWEVSSGGAVVRWRTTLDLPADGAAYRP